MIKFGISTALSLLATTALAQPAIPSGPPVAPAPQTAPGDGPPPGGFPNMPSMAETAYNTVIDIRDGGLTGAVGAMVHGDATNPTGASGISLTSGEPALNPLIVSGGKSAYTLRDSKIVLSGPGTNDFLGTGAGVMVREKATLVLVGDDIETNARISSAAVAAEGATLRIYDSRLVANGGPLPTDYKPIIGPGMMEPPAPLGLVGTARTLLAMSNSRTFVYNSVIEADGWGAVSTDATGGNLYVEVNDSKVLVRRDGYGTYADFGAHVVFNRSRIDSGGVMGIIAGKAAIDFNEVTGKAAGNVMMIHSVMAFDPAEKAQFTLTGSDVAAGEAAMLVKSANADITLDNSHITSASGVLLAVRKNEDPNATQTHGAAVPGVHLAIRNCDLEGDVRDSDPDRATHLALQHSRLSGALQDVVFSADDGSAWIASADSSITLENGASANAIDAVRGVTISAHPGASGLAAMSRRLPGGGRLVILPE